MPGKPTKRIKRSLPRSLSFHSLNLTLRGKGRRIQILTIYPWSSFMINFCRSIVTSLLAGNNKKWKVGAVAWKNVWKNLYSRLFKYNQTRETHRSKASQKYKISSRSLQYPDAAFIRTWFQLSLLLGLSEIKLTWFTKIKSNQILNIKNFHI